MDFLTVASKENLCFGTHQLESQYMLEWERMHLVLVVCLVLGMLLWSSCCLLLSNYCQVLSFPTLLQREWKVLYILVSPCLIVFFFHQSTWAFFHRISMLWFLTIPHLKESAVCLRCSASLWLLPPPSNPAQKTVILNVSSSSPYSISN